MGYFIETNKLYVRPSNKDTAIAIKGLYYSKSSVMTPIYTAYKGNTLVFKATAERDLTITFNVSKKTDNSVDYTLTLTGTYTGVYSITLSAIADASSTFYSVNLGSIKAPYSGSGNIPNPSGISSFYVNLYCNNVVEKSIKV